MVLTFSIFGPDKFIPFLIDLEFSFEFFYLEASGNRNRFLKKKNGIMKKTEFWKIDIPTYLD